MTSEAKLFRRPQPSKLVKIDLTKAQEPSYFNNNDSSSSRFDDSFNQESSDSNLVKLPEINKNKNECTLCMSSSSSSEDLAKHIKLINSSKVCNNTLQKNSVQILRANVVHDLQTKQSSYTGRSLVKHFKPLGPDPLPSRPVKLHQEYLLIKKIYYDNLTEPKAFEKEEELFDLNDFLLENNFAPFFSHTDKSQVSKYTYNQMCKILEEKIRHESNKNINNLCVQTLVPDIEPFENRRPIKQVMLEMAAYIKQQLSQNTDTSFKTKFIPISKWQRKNGGAHTELIIYEDKSAKEKKLQEKKAINDESDEITPAQIAILDSLLHNGQILNLKANFIDKLPDISTLRPTLLYFNLSYNHFEEIPDELFDLSQLEVLKMRNNPLKCVPDRAVSLQNLKLLNVSYCQLSEWPACLSQMPNLMYLDMSYNKIKMINENVTTLISLRGLNLEGNEIEYVPCSMIKMSNLEKLSIKNNYLHPLIWRNLIKNKVQSLLEIAAAKFVQVYAECSPAREKLSPKLQSFLKENLARCDCCEGKRFGNGLSLIKPCEKMFGVKYLPFMFKSCSPECYHAFKSKTNL